MQNSVAPSATTALHHHSHHPPPGPSHLPRQKSCSHQTTPQPRSTSSLPSFSASSHAPCSVHIPHISGIIQLSFRVWLISFIIMVSRFIHVVARQNFLPFHGWIMFHCVERPYFVYAFLHRGWTLGLFRLWAVVNDAPMNTPHTSTCFSACFQLFWVST